MSPTIAQAADGIYNDGRTEKSRNVVFDPVRGLSDGIKNKTTKIQSDYL